ncbi:hypothetical protein SAICODRAFT_65833 [Saitoella complicata NRRL Y-17804]|nr:uncharacterized protein SAICODRAFT_65833 [Saitoella complicata NRRL Y-17804]ODQ53017.1 hypothetical protein SAICODRAFT_65833 [Saitoella complicata NRRL Y-17804]
MIGLYRFNCVRPSDILDLGRSLTALLRFSSGPYPFPWVHTLAPSAKVTYSQHSCSNHQPTQRNSRVPIIMSSPSTVRALRSAVSNITTHSPINAAKAGPSPHRSPGTPQRMIRLFATTAGMRSMPSSPATLFSYIKSPSMPTSPTKVPLRTLSSTTTTTSTHLTHPRISPLSQPVPTPFPIDPAPSTSLPRILHHRLFLDYQASITSMSSPISLYAPYTPSPELLTPTESLPPKHPGPWEESIETDAEAEVVEEVGGRKVGKHGQVGLGQLMGTLLGGGIISAICVGLGVVVVVVRMIVDGVLGRSAFVVEKEPVEERAK